MRPHGWLPVALVLVMFAQVASATTYLEHLAARHNRPHARQNGVVNANICAAVSVYVPLNVTVTTCLNVTVNLGLSVLGIPLGTKIELLCTPTTSLTQVDIADNVCLCLASGALTPGSLTTIGGIISANGTGVNTLTSLTNGAIGYTASSLLNYITSAEPPILGKMSTSCTYPTNAIPNSCAAGCGYYCPTGTYLCGNQCVANAVTCKSGVPGTRRSLDAAPGVLCPTGLTGCGVPSQISFTGYNFECLDVANDLESCGGCAYPLPGQSEGVDCTAIQHTTSVSCLQGKCIIGECEEGYRNTGKACIAEGDPSELNESTLQRRTFGDVDDLDIMMLGAVEDRMSKARFVESMDEKRGKKAALRKSQVDTKKLRAGGVAKSGKGRLRGGGAAFRTKAR